MNLSLALMKPALTLPSCRCMVFIPMQQPQRPWAENDDTQIWLIAFLTYQINEFMIGNKATGADLSAVKRMYIHPSEPLQY